MSLPSDELKEKSSFFSSNTGIFVYYVFLYLCLNYLINRQSLTDDVYFQSLNNRLPINRIRDLIAAREKNEWISYLLFPIILLIKISLTVFCIHILKYINNIKISTKLIFRIVIISEAAFILGVFVKYIYLLVFPPQDLEDVTSFSLSLGQLFKNVPAYLSYILATINVFELIYFVLLAKGIQKYTKYSFKKSLSTVGLSYGVGLFLWVIIVTFLLIQLS